MYPVDGYVFVQEKDWRGEPDGPPKGPFKVLGTLYLYQGSKFYYELEGADRHYEEHELQPASHEEALYFKLTQGVSNEPC